eukprot:s565_g1.t1
MCLKNNTISNSINFLPCENNDQACAKNTSIVWPKGSGFFKAIMSHTEAPCCDCGIPTLAADLPVAQLGAPSATPRTWENPAQAQETRGIRQLPDLPRFWGTFWAELAQEKNDNMKEKQVVAQGVPVRHTKRAKKSVTKINQTNNRFQTARRTTCVSILLSAQMDPAAAKN